MKDVLVVFARYPEVGKCKTRLIAAVGPQGAADLHEKMTRHTLAWARQLSRGWSAGKTGQEEPRATTLPAMQPHVEVRFAGGNAAGMRQLFGDDLSYVPQGEGDLGRKMRSAVECHLSAGAKRVVVVGTDCPQLTAPYIRAAYERLNTHSVCIAPAYDGGYTAIGIRCDAGCSQRETVLNTLFDGIDWGSQRVLNQTVAGLSRIEATFSLLPVLSDVDYPEDLSVWQQVASGNALAKPLVSVVIPTLGEEERLVGVIERAKAHGRAEVLVVSAGDSRETKRLAAEQQVQLLLADRGRGRQLNLGAEHARGDILVFLHADTFLPEDYVDCIERTLAPPTVAGGAFQLRIDSLRRSARWVEHGVRLRSKWLQMPYGDQALFMRRSMFDQLGGFREQPIMEDYEFVRRLRKHGAVALADRHVVTSPRRWHRVGVVQTTAINQLMIAGYHLGVPPSALARFYRRR